MTELPLALRSLERRFGDHRAVAGIDLDLQQGEFVTLLGPSGCGKTTTLNMIAGFLAPSAGRILLAGRDVQGLPPFRRDIGVVFQDYALFPNMSVAENVAFGLRMRGVGKAEIARQVTEMVSLVKLAGMGDRRPLSLSGGQRQRVALARALVIRPKILLMDEPLSNLDLKLREEMRVEISLLQRRLRIPTIFVTHDQVEALAMSDRIIVMNAGHIEQSGSPAEIYETPQTRFVAEFIGSTNLIPGALNGAGEGVTRVDTSLGPFLVRQEGDAASAGAKVDLAFRPERVMLSPDAASAPAAENGFAARVESVSYLGARSEIRLVTATGATILADRSNDGPTRNYAPGEDVHVAVRAADCRILAAPAA